MKKSDSPKVIALRSLIALLCIILGILIAGQLRSVPLRVTNPVAPYASLKETRDDLSQEQNELKEEIKTLQKEISAVQLNMNRNVLSEKQMTELNLKKARSGVTKLNGPGVIITLDDGSGKTVTEDTIIHAADLRDVVNALWAAGAEAVAVNGQRIVSNTAIDCIVNTILINDVRLTNPYRIEAIGRPDALADFLNDAVSLSILRTRSDRGEIINRLEKNDDLTLPEFDGSLEINWRSG